MLDPNPTDVLSPQAHTPPSSSARSSSIDDDSWIDHFIDDGFAHLATARYTSRSPARWRDTRAPATASDVEAQQSDHTQPPEIAIRLHPLATVPSGIASKVDYEQGLEFTREDKRAMIIVFLSVLAFTIIVIVAMVASGQQGKDDEWLSDHSRISMINESSLGTALPSVKTLTDQSDTTQLFEASDSTSRLPTSTPTLDADQMPSMTSRQSTITIEIDHVTARLPTRSSLDIPLATPTTIEVTSSSYGTSAIYPAESTSGDETSMDTTTVSPEPGSDTVTATASVSKAPMPAPPTPSSPIDTPVVPVASPTVGFPSLESITSDAPGLHSAVVTSPVNLSTGWGGSLVISTWTMPAKTIESTLNIVPTSSAMSAAAMSTTTAELTSEATPLNARPDRRPGEMVNSILHVIGEGLEQMGHH
ncbi:hypothetical protein B0A48_02422 [Cryoendolithus antarcticus]|uniref:Uncharacterized protein n=1 Tax=Cryoendolithus antarcticus TaxID=1507870 RepID=A0A1V8TNX5_9PEZI|nr:hypothetical protein B0A48_02422 [Cryoendolithus antarcticus]